MCMCNATHDQHPSLPACCKYLRIKKKKRKKRRCIIMNSMVGYFASSSQPDERQKSFAQVKWMAVNVCVRLPYAQLNNCSAYRGYARMGGDFLGITRKSINWPKMHKTQSMHVVCHTKLKLFGIPGQILAAAVFVMPCDPVVLPHALQQAYR